MALAREQVLLSKEHVVLASQVQHLTSSVGKLRAQLSSQTSFAAGALAQVRWEPHTCEAKEETRWKAKPRGDPVTN